jgi:hypothetical protein
MNDNAPDVWLMRLYIVLASTAGAVTGALVDKSLTLQGKFTAFFIGFATAIFVVPLAIARFWPGVTVSPEIAGIYYLFATCANWSLPPFIRSIAKRAGDPLAFIRPKGIDQ